MMECCGEERVGKFCSECGSKLAVGTIGGLLRHIKASITTATSSVDHYKAQDESASGRESHLKRSESVLRKWTSWENELIRLIGLDRKTKKAAARRKA